MIPKSNACTCGGDPDYHTVCHMTNEQQREDFRKAKAELIAAIDANAAVGQAVRRLLLPGVKRKTYRRDELQAIVDAADNTHRANTEEKK